jgi:hypothetical protein
MNDDAFRRSHSSGGGPGTVWKKGGSLDSANGAGRQGVTEVRVHGVGGTPPEMILDDPHLERVSGDNLVGFYRPASDDVNGHRHREACAWGKITAGSATSALWMLLLPFALANLAGWTHPPVPGVADPDRRTAERPVKSLVRLFGLSITIGFVLMLANITMDVVAFQCGALPKCIGNRWWLAYFKWPPFATHPAMRLAVGGLMATVGLMLLAWASRNSYQTLESYEPAEKAKPMGSGEHADRSDNEHPSDVGLPHPDFWRGRGPVGQVRDLHLTAGFGLLTYLVAHAAGPFLGSWHVGAVMLQILGLALVVVAALGVLWPQVYVRPALARPARFVWLKRGSRLLLVASLALAALAGTSQVVEGSRLVALDRPIKAYFALQGALLFALFILQAGQRLRGKVPKGVAFQGFGSFAVASMSLFALSSVWAGGLIRIVDLLGLPIVEDSSGPSSACLGGADKVLLCYADYHQKTAIVALVVIAALIVVGFRIAWFLRRQSRKNLPAVEKDLYESGWTVPSPNTESGRRRLGSVARGYGLSQLVVESDSLVLRVVLLGAGVALFQHFLLPILPGLRGWVEQSSQDGAGIRMVVVAAAALVVAILISLRGRPRSFWMVIVPVLVVAFLSLTFVGQPPLVNGASWAVTLLPVALAGALYGGLRNPERRRSVGVIWDVITFWPRHYQPFAPPCYGERVVPQLKYRLQHLAERSKDGDCGRVLVSAHSQGTIIATATLMQVDPEPRRHMALFTYGSPVDILYKRMFPAYYGPGVVAELKEGLSDEMRWPWQHFFCRTDPLGILLEELGPPELEKKVVAARPNTQLFDPYPWQSYPGEPPLPMGGHSAYLRHRQFLERTELAMEELLGFLELERSKQSVTPPARNEPSPA